MAFEGDLAQSAAQRQLLQQAQQLLPGAGQMPAYSQAIMDLGATVCLPRQPKCQRCPMIGLCLAERQGNTQTYPVKTSKLKRSSQRLWLLWAVGGDGSVWLERRPETGIWGGLQCLPVFDSLEQLLHSLPERARRAPEELPAFLHALTHRDLHLHPVLIKISGRRSRLGAGRWWGPAELAGLGLPAPVRKLLTV